MAKVIRADQRSTARKVALLAGVVGSLGILVAPQGTAAATPTPKPSATFPPPPPSAIGDDFVQWLAVSPAYKRTGTVVAQSVQLQCPQNAQCRHLWVSHDGGASWRTATAKGWNGGHITIAIGANGKETMFAGVSAQLARSDDGGDTWSVVGHGGVPTVLPTYATDGGIAVASTGHGSDYVMRQGAATDVPGSGSNDSDVLFTVSPTFPDGGRYSPALVTALDDKTSALLVLHCSAQFSCGTPTVVPGPASGSAMTGAGTVLLTSTAYPQDGTVFADTPMGVAKSVDGGVTFTPLNVASNAGANATTTPMMALAPGYSERGGTRTAYVAVFQLTGSGASTHTSGGIYRTDDGGSSWIPWQTTGPFQGGAPAVAVAPDGRLFAGFYDAYGHGGLLCSTNEGRTWQVSCRSVGAAAGSGGAAKNAGGAGCQQARSCGDTAGAGAQANTGSGHDSGSSQGGDASAGTVAAGDSGSPAAASTRGGRFMAVGALALAGVLLALGVAGKMVRRRTRRASAEP